MIAGKIDEDVMRRVVKTENFVTSGGQYYRYHAMLNQ